MGTDNDSQFENEGLDPEKLDGVHPLSFFFPEVTEGEARILDRETLRIMQRRVRVIGLYRQRMTMMAIAEEVGCSYGTVHSDMHTVLEGYKRIAAHNVQDHLADQLQRLAAREADIEAEWEKSKGDRVETFAEQRSSGNTAKLKKKQAYGDPRLAHILLQCWDRRCRLLGLLEAGDVRGRDGLPPVKLVAGLDPLEVV